jgi:hypothetical protein
LEAIATDIDISEDTAATATAAQIGDVTAAAIAILPQLSLMVLTGPAIAFVRG